MVDSFLYAGGAVSLVVFFIIFLSWISLSYLETSQAHFAVCVIGYHFDSQEFWRGLLFVVCCHSQAALRERERQSGKQKDEDSSKKGAGSRLILSAIEWVCWFLKEATTLVF